MLSPFSHIDAVQYIVGSWAEATFPQATPQSIVAHLRREVEELAAAVDAWAGGDQVAGEAIKNEASDCALLLLHLAHRLGYSLRLNAIWKHNHNLHRKWGEPDHEGVVEHLRDEVLPEVTNG